MRTLMRTACAGLLAAWLCLCLSPLPPGQGEAYELDGDANLALETRLSELGFFTEVPDERGDESTRVALCNFQTANDLEPTGALDGQTLTCLRAEESVSKQAYLTGLAEQYQGRALAEGASGYEVSELQKSLSSLGYYAGRADGVYGTATGDAISLFQMAAGLKVTGVADGATLYRLLEGDLPTREEFLASRCAVKGDAGSRVKLAQQRLKGIGFFSGDCTGDYGDLTALAVEQFQKANALPVSGSLDLATCGVLYSLDLQGPKLDHLEPGERGDHVRALQEKLAELGYYAGELSGVFDTDTQTALCLFRIANRQTVDASDEIDAENAVLRSEAGNAFLDSRREANSEAAQGIVDTAEAMLGQSFDAGNPSARFPGFSFVQSVFAQNGIAFAEPGEIVGETEKHVSRSEAPEAGSIVVLEQENNGSTQLQLTISLGAGRLAFLDESGQYIVSGELRQVRFENAYVWALGGTHD